MTDDVDDKQPLAGQHVWLTRPAGQNARWQAGLEQAGARVDCQPLLDINPPDDETAARKGLAAAEQADIIVVTSPNAVRGIRRLQPDFMPAGRLCAVGRGTGQALETLVGRRVHVPDVGDTSEALLAIPLLADVAGRQVALLSGAGGRGKLAARLSARGARLHKVVLYQRRPAVVSPQRLTTLVQNNHAAVVTSGEALQHLCRLIRQADDPAVVAASSALQLVVPSRRVVQLVPDDLFALPPRAVTQMTVEGVVTALASACQGTGQ